MDPALLTTLRAHNPWLEQPERRKALLDALLPSLFIPRSKELELQPGRAELVVGPRQAGKSTWKGCRPDRFLFLSGVKRV